MATVDSLYAFTYSTRTAQDPDDEKKAGSVRNAGRYFQEFLGMQQDVSAAMDPDEAEEKRHQEFETYATIEQDGEVIAEIANNGAIHLANSADSGLFSALPANVNDKGGPDLAQARSEVLAQYLGGKVVKSASAMTQDAYDLAVERAGAASAYAAFFKSDQAATEFAAQRFAQGDAAAASNANTAENTEEVAYDATQEFLDFMDKTPEERMFESMLRDRGLTPEEFAALPPEEQRKILSEIQEEIRKKLAEGEGTAGDGANPPSDQALDAAENGAATHQGAGLTASASPEGQGVLSDRARAAEAARQQGQRVALQDLALVMADKLAALGEGMEAQGAGMDAKTDEERLTA